MSKTIIVLDTNILVRRPFLDSSEWTDLSNRSDEWHLHFLVPDVVLMETVNVVRRDWKPDKSRLEQLSSWVHELGMGEALQSILAAADDRAATYETSLRDRLDDLGFEIEPLPATIDHLDIASRASERRAPYGVAGEGESAKSKDGYRDTLIWFCVLDVAQRHPECDVWFVSDNFKDFGAKPTSKDTRDTADYPLDWHSELVPELGNLGLSGRVFYARSLRRLEQHLLAKFSPLEDADRDSLWGTVDRHELDSVLLQVLLSTALDPRSAALPLDTMTARIASSVRSSDSVTLSEAAYRAGGAWTARFTCEVDAGIEVSRRSGDVELVRKRLTLAGRIELTADNQVSDVTVESIRAQEDDPQHRAWERADAVAWAGHPFSNIGADAVARMNDSLNTLAADAVARAGHPFSNIGADAVARMNDSLNTLAADAVARAGHPFSNIGADAVARMNDSLNTLAADAVARMGFGA
ncbi:PIN domain-containing protein [Rhodococcus sp. LW-XY12]|uniref:PIN domain-containing protein n=1 Tax=Rhodococcus sp. LW-XY12 TaxID=2856851 RepID=UPI001C58E6AF|nr:PIN domain-containing protein [Rhodococcus sp. LW-XY12]QXU56353.1 DUF4935 domain-containing protein [Rhodococcus sp. LW-XY12]